MFVKKNNSKTTINMGGGFGSGVTTLTVTSGAVFPSTFPFLITIWDKVTYFDPGDDAGMEIVKCTARTGNDLTVVRAQESTTNQAHSQSEAVEMLVTKGTFEEIEDAAYVIDLGETSNNTVTYAQKTSLAFTPKYAGNYLVNWSMEQAQTNAGVVTNTRLQYDNTTDYANNADDQGTSYANGGWRDVAGVFIIENMTVAAHTIDMDFASASAGKTSYIRKARIVIRRLT